MEGKTAKTRGSCKQNVRWRASFRHEPGTDLACLNLIFPEFLASALKKLEARANKMNVGEPIFSTSQHMQGQTLHVKQK